MLEVVTYANIENSGVKNLLRSLSLQGYNYNVVGQGDIWKGYMTKIKAYRDYARNKKGTLLLFLDSFDILAQRPVEDLLEYYYSYKKPIVVGAELLCFPKNCFRLDKYWQDREKPERNFHVNSGFILGRGKDLEEALTYMLELNIADDQRALAMYIETHPSKVELDTKSLLVANLTYLQYGHVFNGPDGGIYYKITGSKPCFFHTMSKNVDMLRYNYLGRRLLGKDYLETSFEVILADWKNKCLDVLKNYSSFASYLLLFLLLSLLAYLLGSLPLFLTFFLLSLLILVLLLREGWLS